MPAMTSSWERTCAASGWAKTVRRKCTQQTPRGVEQHGLDRGLEPGVGVGDDQLDVVQAAGLEPAQDAVQNAPSSLSPTSKPSTSRRPSAATPVATTTAWETTR